MLGLFKRLLGGKAGGGHSCPSNLTPEQDIAIAEAEVAGGDLKHAAHHVACALSVDPERAEWRALLDRIADLSPDPLALTPLEKDNYYATVAMRAYLLHRLNRLEEAVGLILQVMNAKPDADYLKWAVRWLNEPEAKGRVDDLMGVKAFLHGVMTGVDSGEMKPGAGYLARPELPELIRAANAALPDDDALAVLTVGVLRRIGRGDIALEMARAAYESRPDWHTAIALAGAHRTVRDFDAAIALYCEAARLDPTDLSANLDAADLHFQTGQMEEAETLYAGVAAREPNHPWATPSLLSVRYERTGDETFLRQLRAYAGANPENGRAQEMMGRRRDFFGADLLYPAEASVNAIEQMIASRGEVPAATAESTKIELTLSSLEAPSAHLAIDRELAASGRHLAITTQTVQKPDPRKPRGPVEFQLWRYEGTDGNTAVPNVPAPPPEIAATVAELARRPYAFDAWVLRAEREGKRLGPGAAPALLATMVHPPDRPAELADVPWWQWLYRVQIAAALLVAHVDGGWVGSVRRRALLSLVNGPMDWSVDAAVVGLCAVAVEDPAIEREVIGVLRGLLGHTPRPGHVCYEAVTLLALIWLPSVPEAECRKLAERLRGLYEG